MRSAPGSDEVERAPSPEPSEARYSMASSAHARMFNYTVMNFGGQNMLVKSDKRSGVAVKTVNLPTCPANDYMVQLDEQSGDPYVASRSLKLSQWVP